MRLSSMDIINNINDQGIIIKNRWNLLRERVSECDKKISDLEHLIEFFDFNLIQESKIMRMMSGVLRERREIKNEMNEIRPLIENPISFNCGCNIPESKVFKRIESATKQNLQEDKLKQYRVKVLQDLLGKTLTTKNKPNI